MTIVIYQCLAPDILTNIEFFEALQTGTSIWKRLDLSGFNY